jgi:acyl-coenzyme A thioesterase PaaI-like protein
MMQKAWATLSPKPGGKALFSRLFGSLVPYTGSIKPEIVELRPGYAKLRMRDRKAVRNHLNSVHAIALMNLAEATSGLAMNFGLPASARAIVTKLEIEYLKKARGTLTSTCECGIPDTSEDRELQVTADIHNEAGEVVARAIATWRVGPKPA